MTQDPGKRQGNASQGDAASGARKVVSVAKEKPGKAPSGEKASGRNPPANAAPDAGAPGAGGPKMAVKEIGGPKGPEPTRYGDWERKGICVDF